MLNIAICDDSLTDRIILEKLIKQYAGNIGIEVNIDGYHSAENLLGEYEKKEYNLIFMDIFLGGMKGTDAARILVQNDNCSVVFTTSSVEFALEGFEIGVLHYVVKPYSYEKIAKSMEKYVKAYYRDEMAVIQVKPIGNEPEQKIRQNDISCVESFDKIRCIHVGDSEVKTYLTMNEIYNELNDKTFCRPHRSYIVNMAYVSKINKSGMELKDGRIIPVSRGMYDDIAGKYANYSGQGLL